MQEKKPRKVRQWTPDEIEILEKHAGTMTASQIQKQFLPHRCKGSIHAKATQLGFRKPKGKRMDAWSPEEIQTLKQHAGEMTAEQLQKTYFPNRTAATVSSHIRTLGLGGPPNPRWTKTETDYLIRHYPTEDITEIAKRLGRTTGTVATKAKLLKLRKKYNNAGGPTKPWRPEEDAVLLKHHKTMTYEEIHEKFLPNRTVNAIGIHLTRLQKTKQTSTPWSTEELRILKTNYTNTSREEMQKLLPGRTQLAITMKATELKLHKR